MKSKTFVFIGAHLWLLCNVLFASGQVSATQGSPPPANARASALSTQSLVRPAIATLRSRQLPAGCTAPLAIATEPDGTQRTTLTDPDGIPIDLIQIAAR